MEGQQAERPKTSRKRKPKLHPVVRWLRTAGVAAELFGWGGLLLAGWFWPGVIFIYAGFVLLAVDAWLEPELQGYTGWKLLINALLLALVTAFSVGIVFADALLNVTAFMMNAEYPPGSSVAGIPWKPQFTEVQIRIENSSEKNYEDLNLLIRPTDPIAAIAQQIKIPDVSFEDKNAMTMRMVDVNSGTQKSNAVPLDLLATDAGYRMRCPHLPAHSDIQIIVALADIRWDPASFPDYRNDKSAEIRDKNYILRTKSDDFSTYWWGHSDGNVYAPRPTSTDFIRVDGEYTAVQRTRHFSLKLNVGGDLRR